MKKLYTIFSLSVCLLTPLSAAWGGLLFDTATGSQTLDAVVVNDYAFEMHRFEVTSSTTLSTVGGYFQNLTGGSVRLFGAVIALSGPSDLPDSLDLSTADLLGTTVFDVAAATAIDSGNIGEGNLSLALNPGWYALAFGSGKFGADSILDLHVEMPGLMTDLDPQLPFTAILPGNEFGTTPRFTSQRLSPEFFATTVPEPDSIFLLGLGFVALTHVARSARRKQGAIVRNT